MSLIKNRPFVLSLIFLSSIISCDSSSTKTTSPEQIIDTTPPVINLIGAADISVELNDEYIEQGATALDDIDHSVNVQIDSNVNTQFMGIYTVTYSAEDTSGNSSQVSRTVRVIHSNVIDSTPPSIQLIGENTIVLQQGDSYVEQGVIATDNIDTKLQISTEGTVNTNIIGDYTITYTATDLANNSASTSRYISIVPQVNQPISIDYFDGTNALLTTVNNSAALYRTLI